jgi:ATP adenylyltransferase
VRVGETRVAWDMDAYLKRVRSGCYVCRLLAGDPEYFHHVVYRDETAVAFLCKYPSVRGHLMVAPTRHREHVVTDFSEPDYLALQAVVHRAGLALQRVVETERLYVLSLGSQQGNQHMHWHLVPLAPGVPYDEQQLHVLSEERGWLQMTHDEMAALASAIGSEMADRS